MPGVKVLIHKLLATLKTSSQILQIKRALQSKGMHRKQKVGHVLANMKIGTSPSVAWRFAWLCARCKYLDMDSRSASTFDSVIFALALFTCCTSLRLGQWPLWVHSDSSQQHHCLTTRTMLIRQGQLVLQSLFLINLHTATSSTSTCYQPRHQPQACFRNFVRADRKMPILSSSIGGVVFSISEARSESAWRSINLRLN